MKRILIPTDFSEHAERGMQHGLALARLFGAHVELMTAVHLPPVVSYPGFVSLPETYLSEAREQASSRLEEISAPLRAEGLDVSWSLAIDEPGLAIQHRAQETDADFIALGTRGHTGVAHVILGSVAERTARHAHCPVLTAHADSPEPRRLQRILATTDFSEHAGAAIEWARGVAAKAGATLLLTNTYYIPVGLDTTEPLAWDSVEKVMAEDAAHRLGELANGIDDCPVRTLVSRGRPDSAAIRVAEEHDVDLIAIGTHGRTGLAHILLGSTAERIIRRSHVPVVAVKPAMNR